jgi:hypothetical protein
MIAFLDKSSTTVHTVWVGLMASHTVLAYGIYKPTANTSFHIGIQAYDDLHGCGMNHTSECTHYFSDTYLVRAKSLG